MRLSTTFILIFSFGFLIFAVAVDAYLPEKFIVSALYAIPIMIASLRFRTRDVILFGLVSIIAYLAEAISEKANLTDWIIGLIGLLILFGLTVQLVRQRSIIKKFANDAQNAKQNLQRFMGMISHDLAQPITTINAYSQILQKNSISPKEKKMTYQLIISTMQLQRMANDLKEASRIGTDQFTVNKVRCNLILLLKKVIAEQKILSKLHTIQLKSPSQVEGFWDEQRLYQLFTNLISNAIKYSPKGGIVTIEVIREDNVVKISFSDQGIGMTHKQLSSLFQPFYRIHNGTYITGSGLGLYISKAIAQAHNGSITVKSKKGRGSTFTVVLPVG